MLPLLKVVVLWDHFYAIVFCSRRDLPDGSKRGFYTVGMSLNSNAHYLLTIWYKPGSTLRSLLAAGRGHSVACSIAGLFGFFLSIRLSTESAAESFELWVYPAGLAGGIVGLYFFALLVRNFGRWFGGQSSLHSVRTAMGLGLLPWLLLSALLSGTLFSGLDAATVSVLMPVFFVLFLYGYVLLLLCAMAVLDLGALRATFTLALSLVVALFLATTLASIFVRPT